MFVNKIRVCIAALAAFAVVGSNAAPQMIPGGFSQVTSSVSTATPSVVPGLFQLDGSNKNFVSFGADVGQFRTNPFTVAFWLQTSEKLRYFDLAGNRQSPSHGNFMALRMAGVHETLKPGTIAAEVDEDADGKNYIGLNSNVTGFNDGRWHHVSMSRRGGRVTLYVDGECVGQAFNAGIADVKNGNDFRIGRSLVMDTDRFAPVATFSDLRILPGAYKPVIDPVSGTIKFLHEL